MRWFRRIALVLVVLVAMLGLLAYWQIRTVTHGPLPQTRGTLSVAGLRAPVDVFRDARGVPHLYAENHHDLFFAQGYVQAQDRWWQMAFYRRICQGRLSEVAGKSEDVQALDTLMRTLDLHGAAARDWAALPEEDKPLYEAFVAGVNAYIESRPPRLLALEYSVLGLNGLALEVEPYSPVDCLAFGKLMGYTFSGRDLQQEPRRQRIREVLDDARWNLWNAPFPYDYFPTTIAEEDLPQLAGMRMPEADPPEAPVSPAPPAAELTAPPTDASNAWAVSGALTQSGKPMLASDPHQGIDMPNLWYEIGLHSAPDKGEPALNLYGYCAPLLPFVQAGHNDYIAWGLTNVSGSNALDLFRIRVNPDNPLQYEWDGGWRDMTVREEGIRIAGGDAITLEVRETHLGPLAPADAYPPVEPGEALAIRWEGLNSGTIGRTGPRLGFAKNFAEFRAALSHWDYPAANIPYADAAGNIGFVQCGKFPIRPAGVDGLTPTPGWSSDYEWRGFIPFELLPHVKNPASGIVVASNQPAVPFRYTGYIAQELGGSDNYVISPTPRMGHRAKRITERLQKSAAHTVPSMRDIQLDVTVPDFLQVVEACRRLDDLPPAVDEAVELIGGWDGAFDADSAPALFAGYLWQTLVDHIYNDELGDVAPAEPTMNELYATTLLLAQPQHPWWDDVTTADTVETRDDILRASLLATYERVVDEHGSDPAPWAWGTAHVSNFTNPVLGESGVGLIERIANRHGYPTAGAAATVNIARWDGDSGTFANRHIPAYRRVVDFGNLEGSIAVNSTGQSAHPFSPHYDDQIEAWIAGDYFRILWARDAVEAEAVHRLRLVPAD